MSSQVDRAVELWVNLGHPGSAINAYLMSQRLSRWICKLNKEELVQYKKRIWEEINKEI